jgi:peptidoglycan biosynthesis protein MviN/MurJ (putative lipid II flippase)
MSTFWKKIKNQLQNKNLQAVLLLVFWTFGSRALGFVRSVLVINMNTIDAEIFNSSFVLSEAITTFFILGSITVAVLPQMVKLENPIKASQKVKPETKTKLETNLNLAEKKSTVDVDLEVFFENNLKAKLENSTTKNQINLPEELVLLSSLEDLNLSKNVEQPSTFDEIESSIKNNQAERLQQDRLSIYTSWALLILSGFILLLSLLGIIFVEPILARFNLTFFTKVAESGKLTEMIQLNRLLLLAPFLFAIKTILGVFLNVKKNYKIYSLEGVLANFGWILSLSLLYPVWGIVGAGTGSFLGFGLTIFLFAWQSWTLGLRFNLGNFPELADILWQTFHLYWPRLLIFSNARLAELIVAGTTVDPSDPQVTSVSMALNFQGIFIGVVLAVGTVFLPNLTEVLVQKGKRAEFWQMLLKYLKINFFMAIVGMLATIIGTPILLWILTKLPFTNSKGILSDPYSVNLILQLTIIASFSLVFQSVAEVLNRYFIAVEKRWEPLIISIGGNILALQIANLFVDSWGSGGVAVGSFVLNSALMCALSIYFCYWDWQRSKAETEPKLNQTKA